MKKLINILFILLTVMGIITLYARFLGTKGLKTNEYKVTTKIIDDYNGFKIVQLSDIHYGRTTNINDIKKMVKEINLLKPDILVFTGDLYEDNNKITNSFIKEMNNIETVIGKYAVSGPNDSDNNYKEVMEKMNFKIIDDTYDIIYGGSLKPIIITGISSALSSKITTNDKFSPIKDDINKLSVKPIYSILLLHDADEINKLDTSYFNLILASGEQAGQIRLPFFNTFIKGKYNKKYYNEYYKVNNSDVYLSYGIGTSKYSFRFFNKPSINFYRIVNK